MRPLLAGLFLTLLLPCLLAASTGPRSAEGDALRAARALPELERFVSRPTVELSARYEPEGDRWRVLLEEAASDSVVARVSVADDTGRVESVTVSPRADDLDYPGLSERGAIRIAESQPEVRRELEGRGPHTADAEYEDGEWTVHVRVREGGGIGGLPSDDGTKEVARVGVNARTWAAEYVWVGDQVAWQMARGDTGAYGKQANYTYVWLPLALVFAAAFWRTDRLISWRNLDVLALLGFLVSHGFFRAGDSFWSVVLWYPPLLYLLFRTLLVGFGIGERVEKTSNFPTPVLFGLGAIASGFVLALNYDSRVIDVGYAGVVGADRIVNGALPYGNFPDDVGTGDTYGPLNYLYYVPFRLVFGFSGEWDYLPAAHAATAFAFVGCALALVVAGWRLAGAAGAGALFFAWAVHPHTLYATNNNTNDVVVAMVFAVGIAVFTNPLLRGVAISAAFAIKLFPLVLAPLWALHDGHRRRGPVVDFALGALGVALLSFSIVFLDGQPLDALRLFYERTFGFQGERETPWAIWSQVPALASFQRPLFTFAVLLALVVAVLPRRHTARRLAAFSAAVVIAFQLTFNYWFYPYIVWFVPFAFAALLLATDEKTALDGGRPEGGSEEEGRGGWPEAQAERRVPAERP